MTRILYLYAEVMGYTMATIQALVERGIQVHVVHWDQNKLTPYEAPDSPNVYMYRRSLMTVGRMYDLAQELRPTIIVISGWQDKEYMAVARRLRANGFLVVSAFDDQWRDSLRQRVAELLGFVGYFNRYYSHAWVAGVYQFEYARRLGFNKKSIIYDLLSADTNLWGASFRDTYEGKKQRYPHRFLFVGRFELIKGLDTLIRAWRFLGIGRRDWELHLIGDGPLKAMLKAEPGVIVKEFKQPDNLISEVKDAGCFVLPSHREPWGVVVHEFATAGLPLILSDDVGAASAFLIHGFNGYSFSAGNSGALAKQMRQIIDRSDGELFSMAIASHRLSERITPASSAANLLSIDPFNPR